MACDAKSEHVEGLDWTVHFSRSSHHALRIRYGKKNTGKLMNTWGSCSEPKVKDLAQSNNVSVVGQQEPLLETLYQRLV